MTKRFYSKTGERNLNSKTNSRSVALIRFLHQYRPWPMRRLATEFGLSQTAVQKIISESTWTDVDTKQEIQSLLSYADLVRSLLAGGDSVEAPPALAESGASVRCPPYVVESDGISQLADAKVLTSSHVESTQAPTLAECLAELGLSHISELTTPVFQQCRQAQQWVLYPAFQAYKKTPEG